MKTGLKLAVLVIGAIVVYLIFVNLAAFFFSWGFGVSGDELQTQSSGGDILIGLGDSVSVSVVRPRWYGTILENGGPEGVSRTLYLFGLFRLPLRVDGTSMLLVHVLFLAGIGFLGYRLFTNLRRRHYERGFY